jgi:hypothetical protein
LEPRKKETISFIMHRCKERARVEDERIEENGLED